MEVFTSITEPQLNVDVSANKEMDGTRPPSTGQSGPHRLQRLVVVLLIAATVRHIH